MIAYLLNFVLALFGRPLPLIGFTSAASATGTMGLIGLGINIFILVVASLYLVIDFKLIEDNVQRGTPRYMEWYCSFAAPGDAGVDLLRVGQAGHASGRAVRRTRVISRRGARPELASRIRTMSVLRRSGRRRSAAMKSGASRGP